MTRKELVERAGRITPPSAESVREYQEKRELMVADVNRIMMNRPDLEKLISRHNQAMMQDNHHNHALFMSSLFRDFNPAVLVNTVIWVFNTYLAHGFKPAYWPAQLNAWKETMQKHMSKEAFDEIMPVYEFIVSHLPVFAQLSRPDTPAV
ncbi:MAG: hypothetical protein R6X11_08175 [Desulfonatronovibrio sp.]